MAEESFGSYVNAELMISLIKKRPALWDKTTESYKNRFATKAAWEEILELLNPNYKTWNEKTRRAYGKMIIHKWTHIRDNYHRSIKKINEQMKKGHRVTKPYMYSKQLRFLLKVLQVQPNQTLDVNDESVENNSNDSGSEDTSMNYEESEISSHTINTDSTRNPIEHSKCIRLNNANDVNPLNTSLMKIVEPHCSHQEPKVINRHLSFFNGILPSLDDFDENEVLEFQMGVLQLLKSIKSSRQNCSLPTLKIDC